MANAGPIVVGTDLSEAADAALDEAIARSTRTGLRLLVVHVAPDVAFQNLLIPKAAEAIRQHVDGRAGSAVEAEVVIRAGSPHAALIALAEERHASLLVVGASGRSGIGPALFGTTAEQAVRYAPCPVLVARKSPPNGPVLAATDLSEPAMDALREAAAEATRRSVRLVVLYSAYEPPSPLFALGPLVVSPPAEANEQRAERLEAARQTLQSVLAGLNATGETLVVDEPPTRAIVEKAEALGASLTVVGTRGRTGVARVALGSIAEAIIRRAPCSVLAVRVLDP